MVTIGQITRRLRSTIALPIQFLLYLSAHFAERHAVGREQQRFAIVQDAGKPCANSVRIKLDADFSGCVPIIRLSHGQLLMAVSERCGRQRRAGELAPCARSYAPLPTTSRVAWRCSICHGRDMTGFRALPTP